MVAVPAIIPKLLVVQSDVNGVVPSVLTKPELMAVIGMFDRVLDTPEIDLFVRVSVVALPTRVSAVFGSVRVILEAGAGALTVVVLVVPKTSWLVVSVRVNCVDDVGPSWLTVPSRYMFVATRYLDILFIYIQEYIFIYLLLYNHRKWLADGPAAYILVIVLYYPKERQTWNG
jgi:hypothetical protein